MIDKIAETLLDQLDGHSEVEFVRAFAHRLPMMVIADLLGVPQSDIGQFKIWSDAIVEPFSMMASRERRIECAQLVVQGYATPTIKKGVVNSGTDRGAGGFGSTGQMDQPATARDTARVPAGGVVDGEIVGLTFALMFAYVFGLVGGTGRLARLAALGSLGGEQSVACHARC